MLVKKYSNRRLYDTEDSRYITLDELAEKVRRGADVKVVEAKTGEDLTQATLTQIILESNAARLLPVPLLTQLIRMRDDALAEFFGRYVSMALEMYNQARSGAQQVAPYFPFAQMPMQAADAFMRMFTGAPPWYRGRLPTCRRLRPSRRSRGRARTWPICVASSTSSSSSSARWPSRPRAATRTSGMKDGERGHARRERGDSAMVRCMVGEPPYAALTDWTWC